MFSPAGTAILAGVLLLLWRLSRIGRRPAGYPPGPPTLPLIGNIHQVPSKDAHLQFTKWAQEYGPIYSLMLGTKVMVIISNDRGVKDLLDKKSAIYSDRMDMYTAQQIGSGGLRMVLTHYNESWKMQRKMIHALLNVKAAKTYVPYQELENKQMLNDMLNEPAEFFKHIRRYSSSITTSIVFGWRTPTIEDPKLWEFFHGLDAFLELAQTAGAALPDFFPVLQKLPMLLQPAQRRAAALHCKEKALYRKNWLDAKARAADVDAGLAPPFFCADMAKRQADELQQKGAGAALLTDDLAAYIAGTLFEAGADTTASTLYGFVQAMALYPAAQRRLQAELDRAVGGERLPTLDDADSLPYVHMCIKEACRWMPTAVLGATPHAVMQDDEYMGYLIPKGAGVVMNVWGIHRDPERYPEPEKFVPERYEGDRAGLADSANDPDVGKRDQFGFGAGRRICQGIHVAERSLFLGISRLMWGFEISPVVNKATGQPQPPEQDKLTGGLVVLNEPYQVNIKPRSQRREEIMKTAFAEEKAAHLDEKTGQWNKIPEGMKAPNN